MTPNLRSYVEDNIFFNFHITSFIIIQFNFYFFNSLKNIILVLNDYIRFDRHLIILVHLSKQDKVKIIKPIG